MRACAGRTPPVGERIVEGERRRRRRGGPRASNSDARRLVERQALGRAAALGREPRARALDEDLAHRQRGDGQEVRAVGELARTLGGEPEVGLVDEAVA